MHLYPGSVASPAISGHNSQQEHPLLCQLRNILASTYPSQRVCPGRPGLALAASAVTIQGVVSSKVLTSQPSPAHTVCQALFARRRLQPLAALSPSAVLMVRICTSHMLRGEGQSDLLTWELIDLLGQASKPSTLNGHAPYFLKWWAFTKSHQLQLFPASPLAVAAFLLESARGNHTASPTLNRCGALSYFCHLAGSPNPMDHPLCSQVRSALLRKLGIMGKKKTPLLYCQIIHILEVQLAASPDMATLLSCFHMAIMYEGCLRWNDLAQIQFGDIIVTPSFLRLFIQSAKTDKYRQGQWVTISSSSHTHSACQLLQKILAGLALLWSTSNSAVRYDLLKSISPSMPPRPACYIPSSQMLPLRDIPITFSISKASSLPDFGRPSSYPQFLAKLKAWGASIGLCPRDIGTHSLRRGLSSDWALQGIPDRLRRKHGRWRSEQVADGYIDASINIQLLLHFLRK